MGRKKVVDLSIDPDSIDEVEGSSRELKVNLEEEIKSLAEEEANVALPEEASLQDALGMDENEIDAEMVEEGADADEVLPAELDVHTDNLSASELNKQVGLDVETDEEIEKKHIKKSIKETKISKAKKIRSKRYLEELTKVDRTKLYDLDEALALVKQSSNLKFDATVEAHILLDQKKQKGKATETIRGVVKFPSGSVKVAKVVILDESMIEEISKTKKVDFDIALARPADMPKIAKLAKILGPIGKMPNPKIGTVTDDPEKTKSEIESGQVEYRADSFNIVHAGIGKLSWDDQKILDNYNALLAVLSKNKIKTIVLSSTMGPGVKVVVGK